MQLELYGHHRINVKHSGSSCSDIKKHRQSTEFSQYLIMVVHAGEVSPTFVTSDFNEALKTQREHTFTRHHIKLIMLQL